MIVYSCLRYCEKMIIDKQIETRVDILDYMSFCVDERSLMFVLSQRFEKKCYDECLIIKIREVIRKSRVSVNRDGSAYIDVIFNADAMVLEPGEIIVDCRIINRTISGGADYIIAENEYCSFMATSIRQLESIHVGQLIPFRVGRARYALGATKITVNAMPITHDTPDAYYRPNDEPVDMALLAPLIEKIKELTAAIEASNKSKDNERAWKFFDDLLYAYKTPQVVAKTAPLMDVIANLSKYDVVGIPAAIRATSGLVALTGEVNMPFVNNTNIAMCLLDKHYRGLKVIDDMTKTFNTQELLTSHKNVWLILNHIKKTGA